MFAVGDTGATRTLLTEAARPYRLVELDPQEERVVVYAGGEKGAYISFFMFPSPDSLESLLYAYCT